MLPRGEHRRHVDRHRHGLSSWSMWHLIMASIDLPSKANSGSSSSEKPSSNCETCGSNPG